MAAKTELIEEIRVRTDLVRLVGDYLPLRKSGRRYVGLCPFHRETAPSFSVNPEGQFFYCFGCRASGDAFDLIMRLEGLDFPAAAKYLAERAGLRWEAQTPEEVDRDNRRATLLRLNTVAAEVYRRALAAQHTGARAREYLCSRGLEATAIARFGLGYAPATGHTLVEVFRRHGCRLEEAAAIGLVLPSAAGYQDRFRDRLIFPLVDLRGRVIGFGGRAFGDAQPKYLNSSESELFSKGQFLYGLHAAREAIRRAEQAVLVEGYFDAIAAQVAGLNNVVATLGTALTEGHAQLLKRFTRRVVIAFDGDRAGQAATLRGLEVLCLAGLTVQVAILPPRCDPDELVRGEGGEALASLIAAALPLTDFLLERSLSQADLSNPEGRAVAVQACLPALAEVASASGRDGYLRLVAGRTRVPEDKVVRDLDVFLRNRRKERHIMDSGRKDSNTNRCDAHPQANPAEKELLRAILKEYSLLARIREELRAEDFAPGPLRDIYALMLEQTGSIVSAELLGKASDEARPALIELLAMADGGLGPPLRLDALPDCLRRVKAAAVQRRLLEVEAERLALEEKGEGQGERYNAYLREQAALKRQLDGLEPSGFGGA